MARLAVENKQTVVLSVSGSRELYLSRVERMSENRLAEISDKNGFTRQI